MKYFSYTIFALLILPVFVFAQFTGYDDETVNKTYWSSESNIQGGSSSFSNDPIKFGKEGEYSNNTSLNINVQGGNRACNLKSKTFSGYVDYVGCAIRVAVLPFIFSLALVGFIWGVTVMIRNPASEEAQSKGRTFILWGIIGFFVITSVYALIAIMRRTIGFGSNFKDDTTPYVQLKEKVRNLK